MLWSSIKVSLSQIPFLTFSIHDLVSSSSPLGSPHKGGFLPMLSRYACFVLFAVSLLTWFPNLLSIFPASAIFTSGPDVYRNINPAGYFLFNFASSQLGSSLRIPVQLLFRIPCASVGKRCGWLCFLKSHESWR